MPAGARVSPWDLTALLNAADAKASLPERHLWLIRLLEWLRHAPVESPPEDETQATPRPVLRLKHLLNLLDRHPEHQVRVAELLRRIWNDVDSAALLADFGFAPRMDLWRELGRRLLARVLPVSPATTDLGELFPLLFPSAADATWLLALDAEILDRLRTYVAPERGDHDWRAPFVEAIMYLTSAVRASGFGTALRLRMSPELLADRPFRQLARVAEQMGDHAMGVDGQATPESEAALLREAQYLRALLDACRRCADSVHEHLEVHGVSVNVVFEVDQLRERTQRISRSRACWPTWCAPRTSAAASAH
jgi:site-specific recombinase